MELAMLITARCNARCAHCATNCGPEQSQRLSHPEILRLMDEAAVCPSDGPLRFCISGGEPFLDFPLLLGVVAHGAALGAAVSCVSNAYWATSDAAALAKLRALRQAGLAALAISTSRFHQRFVPLARVRRALIQARDLEIYTALKCAVTPADTEDGWPRMLAAELRPDRTEIFPIVPPLRAGQTLPTSEIRRQPGLPRGVCPAPRLTVREDGQVYSCCTPGGFADFLALGDVRADSLTSLHARFALRGKQRILREHGPQFFAEAARARGLGHRLRESYLDVCELCTHIARDPELAHVAEDAADDYEIRFFTALLADPPQSFAASPIPD